MNDNNQPEYQSDPQSEALEARKKVRTDLEAFAKSLDGKSARHRLAAIIDCPDVMRVVRAQPVQDLFLAIKEVGPADCLELLELLSPEQVQGFIDLDSWRSDRIDPKALGDWLELFYAANGDTAVKQLLGLDIELLTLLFKLHVKAYDLVEEEEVPGNPPIQTVTPDHRYCLVFDAQVPKLSMYLKQTVERLYGINPAFITRLITSLAWELPSALEEECYRWRNGRMADLGFLPIDEALEVFSYRSPDAKVPEVDRSVSEEQVQPSLELSTSVLLNDDVFGDTVFESALLSLDEKERSTLKHELVLVTNRAHTAMGGDPGDPTAAVHTLRRVVETAGIGIAYRARGDASRFEHLLRKHSLLALFQIGHSVTVRLQREVRERVRSPISGLDGDGLLRLDAPLREVAAGILKARPLFYAGLTNQKRVDYITFRSLEDTAHAALALSEGAFRAALLGPKGLGLTDDKAKEIGVSQAALGPSHGVYLSTWLARVLLALPEGFEAIALHELETLPQRLTNNVAALDAIAKVAEQSFPLPGVDTVVAAQKRARAYALTALGVLEQSLKDAKNMGDDRFERVRTIYTSAWRDELAAVIDPQDID